MKMFYVTLNSAEEARKISLALLSQAYAVCTNWFPITCAYRNQGQVEQNNEVVLIIKTQENYRDKIETILQQHIEYNNFIAEIDVHSVNASFLDWLNAEVPRPC